jgi:hypothetical protein
MKRISGISVAVAMAGIGLFSMSARPVHAAAAGSYVQDRDDDDRRWEEPPSEFDEYARKGFHEGIEGARRDFDNHRSPDPRHRDEFRHPHVPGEFKEAYRRGFERGYQTGWDHIQHEVRR